MSGWDHPTHGVKNRDAEHDRDVGGVLSDLLEGLIIIVGVEVSEVCVGVALPGQVGVEVLVSFLQDQVVFVESLSARGTRERGGTGVSTDGVFVGAQWRSYKPIHPAQTRKKRKPATQINGRSLGA